MTATLQRPDDQVTPAAPAPAPTGSRRRLVTVGAVAALVATQPVAAAYSQNQNTYLVRAAARSTDPALLADPLVRSADPTPAFTWMSRQLIALVDGPALLHVAWVAAAVAFFAGLMWATTDLRRSNTTTLLWAAAVGLLGSPAIALLGGTWLADPLQGVANQYALGPVWQPSCAAVLLVLGTAAGARHGLRAGPASLLLLAAVVHPTYLLAAGILVAGLLVAQRRPTVAETLRTAAPGLVVAVVGAATVALANLSSFAALTDPLSDEGNEILAFRRIPHHADPRAWLGPRDLTMAAIVIVAVLIARRRSEPAVRALGTVLGVSLGLAAALGTIAVASGSASLLLGFPWRVSVVLVPLAVALLLALASDAAVTALRRRTPDLLRPVALAALAILLLTALAGLRQTRDDLADAPSDGPIVTALREGDARGTGLVPTGRTDIDMGQIPDDIRLNAGLPVYVDWKNNPNEPTEVVAWLDRLAEADAAMTSHTQLCELVEDEALTWVVIPTPNADTATCLRSWATTHVDDVTVAIAPP